MATHSSILAWRIPWTEERGGLQSMGRKESYTTEQLHFHFTSLCRTYTQVAIPCQIFPTISLLLEIIYHFFIFTLLWVYVLLFPGHVRALPTRCSSFCVLSPAITRLEFPLITQISEVGMPHRSLSDHTTQDSHYSVTSHIQFSSAQSLSRVRLFVTPWITACQGSLSFTNSWRSLKLMPIESVMPSSYLIFCHPLLLLPPIPPSIRVFSNESTLHMRWPKYWSFSFSISPSNEHPGLVSFRMGCMNLLAVQGTLKSLL